MAQATYITAAEFAEAYDTRLLADLASDSGSPGTVEDANAILTNAIERASADVESSALRGGRYTTTDLSDLDTADDWSLKAAVADLAVARLYRRRGGAPPPDIQMAIDDAQKFLEDLRQGVQVFNNAGAIAAGKPRVSVINAGDRAELGLVGDSKFFPKRLTQAV